jgi:lipoyl-dependent peroxiredoxin
MSVRSASAVWRGGLKDGKGTISTTSGVIGELAYNFNQRFADEPGTNPEELIAAAHSACFSMALSGELGKAGLAPESIDTKASVTLGKTDKGPTVTQIHLETRVRVPGGSAEALSTAAETAKANCPISRLLNTEITVDARLAD